MDLKRIINVEQNFIEMVSKSISISVGDNFKQSKVECDTISQNSLRGKKLDLIYHAIYKSLLEEPYNERFVANIVSTGWHTLFAFDKETGILYSIMGEKRFKKVQKLPREKRLRNYIGAIVNCFNSELEAPVKQLGYDFGVWNPSEKDIKNAGTKIQNILNCLGVSNEIVKNHALILFKDFDYQLESVRCVAINSNFEICENNNWNDYIYVTDSIIMDNADEQSELFKDPTHGIVFNERSKEKQRRTQQMQEELIQVKKQVEIKESKT